MNVNKVWEYYRDSTQKTSELVRQLAYAGFAVVWILRSLNRDSLSDQMVLSALFLVLTLMLDAFQHIVACYKLRALAKGKERECSKLLEGIESEDRCQEIWRECTSREFELPKNFYLASLICFWLKVATATVAYVLLLNAAVRQLTQ